ncbi:unnamed protein product [Candidula unifasciata]|uniref:medium-chain acyl-CoA ligase n=1 Tax=Candidula unifasciata TaxID=100452 RepID=A0A8S3ZXX4_9EUPU|nr:unnamed protein product [Candidula unifasciata]
MAAICGFKTVKTAYQVLNKSRRNISISQKWNVQISHRKNVQVSQKRNIQLALSGYHFPDYELERKNFSLQIPEFFNFAHDVIDRWADAEKVGLRRTDVPCFWWVDSQTKQEVKLSFQQLAQISKRIANALVSGCGLKKGDRIVVILPKIPEWWFINIACIRAGITLIPGTTLLRTSDIYHRLKLSQANCIITTADLSHYVDEA